MDTLSFILPIIKHNFIFSLAFGNFSFASKHLFILEIKKKIQIAPPVYRRHSINILSSLSKYLEGILYFQFNNFISDNNTYIIRLLVMCFASGNFTIRLRHILILMTFGELWIGAMLMIQIDLSNSFGGIFIRYLWINCSSCIFRRLPEMETSLECFQSKELRNMFNIP